AGRRAASDRRPLRGGRRPGLLRHRGRAAGRDGSMTDLSQPLGYRDGDERRHEVLVRRTAEGDWQVLDTCGEHTTVVETLDGSEDGPEQAQAVARDYLQTVAAVPHEAGRPSGRAIPERR